MSNMSGGGPVVPPGWYRDAHGAMRWWDGVAWTEQTRPVPPARPPGRSSGGRTTPVVIVAGVVLLVLLAGSAGVMAGSGDLEVSSAEESATSSAGSADTGESEPPRARRDAGVGRREQRAGAAEAAPRPEPPSEPEMSVGQENAVGSAEGYLDFSAFSRQGLVEQLEFEGFTREQAEYGVTQNGF